jgi:hypothetical protein
VITFTGSTRTGKQLLKDAGDSNMKRVWLEAGGKSANIVFADCPDLPKAAANAAAGIFYNQGQVCIAGTRLLLEESIADEFIALLKSRRKTGSRATRWIRKPRWARLSTTRMPTPFTVLFATVKRKARWRWMAAATYTRRPSARLFLSTPRHSPRQPR